MQYTRAVLTRCVPFSLGGLVFAGACAPAADVSPKSPECASAPGDASPDPSSAPPLEPHVRGELYRVPVTTMVKIAGGTFDAHEVGPFWMDVTEVTVAQYADCVAAHVCPAPGHAGDWSATWDKPGRENHPVNEVSFYNAKAYCEWVGKRLPTEWEWEWAARGRDEARTYPWGTEAPSAESACWLRYDAETDGGAGTCPVGQFPPSRDGVHNLAGNVWEWTSSPHEDGSGRIVLRGGAWYNDVPERLAAKSRGKNSPYDRSAGSDGIRCVTSTPPPPLDSRIAPVHDE